MAASTSVPLLHLLVRSSGSNTPRYLTIEQIETRRSQRMHTSTTQICQRSTFEFTNRDVFVDESLCENFVARNLALLGLCHDLCTLYCPLITTYAIHIARVVGGNAGFEIIATIESVAYNYPPSVAQISGAQYRAEITPVTEEEVIVLNSVDLLAQYRTSTRVNTNEDGVVVMDATGYAAAQRNEVSISAMERLRRTGKIDAKGVTGTCPVCLDDFVPKADVLKTACSHLFHDQCISRWLQSHNTCPMCRNLID